MTGLGSCHLRNFSTTTRFILPPSTLLSSLTLDVFPRWALNQTNLGPMWSLLTSSRTGWRTPWRKQRQLWPSQKMTWHSITIGNKPSLWSSRQAIWSSLTWATSRLLDHHGSFLTRDWDHSQSTVKLLTVHTASASLCQWVDFIPSSMWSNCLWLRRTPFLADKQLCLCFWKLWTVKKKEILDSRMVNWKLCYLVKWEGFSVEHNFWKPLDNVHALELVADFYRRHPGAACHIPAVEFCSIPFQSVLGHHCLEEWVDVRGCSTLSNVSSNKCSVPSNNTLSPLYILSHHH